MAGPRSSRRTFFQVSAAAMLAGAWPARAEETPVRKSTHTYKTVGACAIEADVYQPPDARGGPRPAVIWIHGGALIMGSRAGIDSLLRTELVRAGCVVVSIDYRLAPETKLAAILEDVHDAVRWVREEGAKAFAIDPLRVAVAGSSAGGYLTLTTGYRVSPPPQALVSYWGYGEVTGPWYSRPDPFYRRQPLVPREEAEKAVGRTPLTEGAGKPERARFYLYCRQQGLWPREVAGLDPDKEPRAFDPFCPVRNVTKAFPPTLLVHGTKDSDVPYEQSQMMAEALARQGVAHELITVPGGSHGLAGAKPDVTGRVRESVLGFLTTQLKCGERKKLSADVRR
ncbi:MAG: alpha/beta hydrolase [Isosphaeraceae bacterium]|nr:alpha/beta hydrolase [Isosphaeraceae bacterium]